MRKIAVSLSNKVEKQLGEYVTSRYQEKPFGKLSKVAEEPISNWLKTDENR